MRNSILLRLKLKLFSTAFTLNELPINPRVGLILNGAFLNDHYDEISKNYFYFYLSLNSHNGDSRNITGLLKFPIAEASMFDKVKEMKRSKTINLNQSDFQSLHQNKSLLRVNFFTKLNTSFPVNFAYDPSPLDKEIGVVLAAIVLLGLYVLIIWELVHRTFAAIIASTMAIGE